MGSTSFANIFTHPTCSAGHAYEQLVETAICEEGGNGYNGTISTTEGFTVVSYVLLTMAEAVALAKTRINNLQKWGNCEAFPLKETIPAQYVDDAETNVTVTVSAADYRCPSALHTAIAKAARVEDDCLKAFELFGEPAVRSTVTTTATKGPTQTRYFVIDSRDGRIPSWNDGYVSQAAARAAISDAGRNPSDRFASELTFNVIAMTRRASGEPLVTGTLIRKTVEATFRIKTRKRVAPERHGSTQHGWYFYGWAAC